MVATATAAGGQSSTLNLRGQGHHHHLRGELGHHDHAVLVPNSSVVGEGATCGHHDVNSHFVCSPGALHGSDSPLPCGRSPATSSTAATTTGSLLNGTGAGLVANSVCPQPSTGTGSNRLASLLATLTCPWRVTAPQAACAPLAGVRKHSWQWLRRARLSPLAPITDPACLLTIPLPPFLLLFLLFLPIFAISISAYLSPDLLVFTKHTPLSRIYPLNDTAVTSLFDKTKGWSLPDRVPWSGMLAGDAAFSPDDKYVFFRRGMDYCVGFIHYTSSLRCRMMLAERLNRTLVVDAGFCTAGVHTRDRRARLKPLHAYYDMDVVRA